MTVLRTVYELFPPRMREKIKLALNAHGHAKSRIDGLKAHDHALGKKRLDHVAEALTRVMASASVTSLRDRCCLEFGAGYVPTEALVFHLLGARQSAALDYNAIARLDQLVAAARAADRSRTLTLLSPYADGVDLEHRFDSVAKADSASAKSYIAEKITYIAPYDMSAAPILHHFDFIHSISVFEHLSPKLAGAILANLVASLAVDGTLATEIDLRDHRDLENAPLSFFSKSDDYDPLVDFDRRGNRLRRKEWLEIFRRQEGITTCQIYEKKIDSSVLPRDFSTEIFGEDVDDILVSWVGLVSLRTNGNAS